MEALSWLEKDKRQTDIFCNTIAKRSLRITEFVLFPFLLAEIRPQIRGYALQHARFIEITCQLIRNVPKFLRVAVSCSWNFLRCCSRTLWLPNPITGQGPEIDIVPLATDILRGFKTTDPPGPWNPFTYVPSNLNNHHDMNFYPRILGIKEIFHVMETHLNEVKPREVDHSITFCIVDPEAGITLCYQDSMNETEEHINKYRRGGYVPWELPATNPWVCEKLPSFSFVSLASVKSSENENTARFSELWTCQNLEQSGILFEDASHTVESIIGCYISFPAKVIKDVLPHNQEQLEIGIEGPNATAIQAVAAVQELAAKNGPWFITFRRYLQQASREFGIPKMTDKFLAAYVAEQAHQVLHKVRRRAGQRSARDLAVSKEPNPMQTMLDELHQYVPNTTSARPRDWAKLLFPADHYPIEKHTWWLADKYYKSVYKKWMTAVSEVHMEPEKLLARCL
ncbi:hypothetical protein BKA65DRAFT_539917 [Rhexocercosporidium sp. MPI-PUGE-AT-0058]|nr:hypothetical protein BKA65DRAFT_539917 [Rhexocercosporidium sp. MPI-PUGE-AT-0058]